MKHPFGEFVERYLDDQLNRARLAEALERDQGYISRMLNEGLYIKSNDVGRENIIKVLLTLQAHHGTLTLKEVNDLLVRLGKAPLNTAHSDERRLHAILVKEESEMPDDTVPADTPPRKSIWLLYRGALVALIVTLLLMLSTSLMQVMSAPAADPEPDATATPIRRHTTSELIGYGATNPQAFIQYYETQGGYGLLGSPLLNDTGGTVGQWTICEKTLEYQELQGCDWCRPFVMIYNAQLEQVINMHGAILNYYLEGNHRDALCLPVAEQQPTFKQQAYTSRYGREGYWQAFENGHAYVTSFDGWRVKTVTGAIRDQYLAADGAEGVYGFPLSPEMNGFQRFENGIIAIDGDADAYTEAQWVEQTASPVTVARGDQTRVSVTLQNVGNRAWDEQVLLRVADPAYDADSFRCPEWPSADIAAVVDGEVAAGESVTLTFDLCPAESLAAGDYTPTWILMRADLPVVNYSNGNPDNLTTIWWNVTVSAE